MVAKIVQTNYKSSNYGDRQVVGGGGRQQSSWSDYHGASAVVGSGGGWSCGGDQLDVAEQKSKKNCQLWSIYK
jgi:hypothetical protein